MSDAATQSLQVRGSDLLLMHFTALEPGPEQRPPARQRLEALIGGELARRLVHALSGAYRGRDRD